MPKFWSTNTECCGMIMKMYRNLYHAEYKCKGPGAETGRRAEWAKQLTEKEAAQFLSIDFINGQEWLPVWL